MNKQVATLLGAEADQVTVNDMATNPISGAVFLSVTKGKGAEAIPAIVRIGDGNNLTQIALAKFRSKRSSCRMHRKTKKST